MNNNIIKLLVSVLICFSAFSIEVSSEINSNSKLSDYGSDELETRGKVGGHGIVRPIRPGLYGIGGHRRRSNAIKDPVVFCYWGSWANLRPGFGAFGVQDLPTDLCTHIAYSFIGLTAEGDLTFPGVYIVEGKSNSVEDFIKLKEDNSEIKLLAAIGGWVEGSTNFSLVSNNEILRGRFVNNVVSYLESKGFDGLEVDWEYPGQRGGDESDKEAFIWLLSDLKEAFEPKKWLLTVSVGSTQYHVDLSYNVPAITELVDYINLMTYDFHGSWSQSTGANAPLYPQLTDDEGLGLNVNESVHTWIRNGAYRNKLILGLGSYGKSFNLTDLSLTDTGSPFDGPGEPGKYTMEAGLLAYYEICYDQIVCPHEWNVTQVHNSYVFANRDNLWVGYDNNNTIFEKGLYARRQNLAGVMFWTADFDDFNGLCGENFTLIRSSIAGYRSGTGRLIYHPLLLFIAMLIFVEIER